MNIEKMFDPNSYTEKAMPVSSILFGALMSSTAFDGYSDQRKEINEKNKALREAECAIRKTFTSEQGAILDAVDDYNAEMHYLELREKFSCGLKLGTMLVLELLGKGGELK